MSAKEDFESLQGKISEVIPGFEIRYKDEDRGFVLKVVATVIGIFNARFMTGYTTTLYPVVYFPNRANLESDYEHYFKVLAHEYVHLWDRKNKGVWFSLSYLMPQIFSVFSLLSIFAIFNLSFLWCLLFLLFLAPFPAYFRKEWEMRGYAMNLAVSMWKNSGPAPRMVRQSLRRPFLSWDYYKMWPFSNSLENDINTWAEKILSLEVLKEGEPYEHVYSILTSSR